MALSIKPLQPFFVIPVGLVLRASPGRHQKFQARIPSPWDFLSLLGSTTALHFDSCMKYMPAYPTLQILWHSLKCRIPFKVWKGRCMSRTLKGLIYRPQASKGHKRAKGVIHIHSTLAVRYEQEDLRSLQKLGFTCCTSLVTDGV